MNVLFDHQIFSTQKIGGISRYFSELLRGFESGYNIKTELGLIYTNNIYLKTLSSWQHIQPVSSLDRAMKWFLYSTKFRGKEGVLYRFGQDLYAINKRESIRKIKQGNFDLFHPTYYDIYFLDYIGNKPFVLTIHDMIYEKYPNLFPDSQIIIENKKLLSEKAAKIIAVSESTKKDITEFLKINPEKIKVIHHGAVNHKVKDRSSVRKDVTAVLPENFFLFVGKKENYKNFNLLLNAFLEIHKYRNDVFLVSVGEHFTKEEKCIIKKLGIYDKIINIFPTDSGLNYLYKNAIALIFPSLEEGFGIPILEAFSCCCPVLCSDIAVFREVAGDAAIYFNPSDCLSLADSMKTIVDNSDLRQKLTDKGSQRLSVFSWDRAVKETFNIYKEAMN